MVLEVIKRFNWIDILIIALFVRVCIIGVKKGFLVEAFKLSGTLAAIYTSFHYYAFLSDLFSQKVNLNFIPLEFLDFLVFLLLLAVGYLLFMLLREVITHLFKVEVVPVLSRWGGLAISVIRGYLLVGLVCFCLAISFVSYLSDSVKKSYSGSKFFDVAPSTYGFIWNNIMSKFLTDGKYNEAIRKVQEKFKE